MLFFPGAKLWNSLPAESKKASSLGCFKKSIQGLAFSILFYTVKYNVIVHRFLTLSFLIFLVF